MRKAYNISILVIYAILLSNMVVKFMPNFLAVALALVILVPLITDRIDKYSKKSKKKITNS